MADKSTIGFGLSQISNPTPEMANWIFRGYFIVSKAILGWLGGLSAAGAIGIPIKTMLLITLTISLLADPIMLGFSKLFGIVPQPVDPAQPVIATQQVDDKGDTSAIDPLVMPPPNEVPLADAFEQAVQDKINAGK